MSDVARIDRASDTERDRTAFAVAPIAMWQEDFTAVEQLCMELERLGVEDLRTRLGVERDLLMTAVGKIRVVDVNRAAVDLVGASSKEDLLGPLPTELLAETALESFMEQILAVWDQQTSLELELTGADFAGKKINCTLHWAAPVVGGVPDYSRVVVMIHDVTAKTMAEERMRQHAGQLQVLLEVGRQITATFDLETVLQRIADAAVELLGSDESLLLLFDRTARQLTRAVGKNYPEVEIASHSFEEIEDGVSGWVIERGLPTISADIATDERNTGRAAERAARFAGTSVAVAPITADGDVIGTLTALNNAPHPPPTDEDLSLIGALAGQAAVAIQNARLYDEIRSAHEELTHTQSQLLQAQKLEAIGSLAAGIAHEINTPIQYVADNTKFLMEAAGAIGRVHASLDALVTALQQGDDPGPALAALIETQDESDFAFLMEEVPSALEQTLEGVQRVAEIVRAMKDFAHPGLEGKNAVDLNRALETTGAVSRNEWKYIADLEFELDESLPMVPALSGPLNQAFLILIVNAAQAIGDAQSEGERGTIRVSTSHSDEWAEVRVSDSGPGVPDHIIDRIFDPFFTTKEVGKGSGQGLSIARSVVTEQHGGSLEYDPSGPGATFVIRLPLREPEEQAA